MSGDLKTSKLRSLNRNRRFDRGVWIIVDQLKVLVAEAIDGFHLRIDFHLWQRSRLAGELLLRLIDVICVEVQVTESVHELFGFKIANLCDHHGKQGVGSDVEGHAKKDVGAALIELAAEFAISHVELKERVAGGECHVFNLAGIPSADDVATTIRVILYGIDDFSELIDALATWCRPIAPLGTIDTTEVAVFVSPFIPDFHFIILKITYVRIALNKP